MTDKQKQQAINRLRRLCGQIRGLEKMLAAGKYCIDILHQSLAAKQSLSGFEDFILENHLKTHVVEQVKSGRKDKAVAEILSLYKLSKRK